MPQNMIAAFAPYAVKAVRYGLMAASTYVVSKGLPGLDDTTMANLASDVVGGIGMAVPVIWSWAEHADRKPVA